MCRSRSRRVVQVQEDDDLAVTNSEVTYTDPWSRKLITEESLTNKWVEEELREREAGVSPSSSYSM